MLLIGSKVSRGDHKKIARNAKEGKRKTECIKAMLYRQAILKDIVSHEVFQKDHGSCEGFCSHNLLAEAEN